MRGMTLAVFGAKTRVPGTVEPNALNSELLKLLRHWSGWSHFHQGQYAPMYVSYRVVTWHTTEVMIHARDLWWEGRVHVGEIVLTFTLRSQQHVGRTNSTN